MKLILYIIYLLPLFSHCQSAEDYASKADIAHLENTIKGLTQKLASVDFLQYAFRVNEMDVNLKNIAKSVEEIKDGSTKKCDCNGGSSDSPARVTGDQSVKSLLENIVKKLETYGNKLLPGHSLILKGQQTVLQKIGDISSLIQTGITKILTSLSSVGDLNSYIEGMEDQIITFIEDESAVVSKQQNILEQKLQKAVDGITIKHSKFDKELKGIREFISKKLEESTDTINKNQELTVNLIMNLERTAFTKCQTRGSTTEKLPTESTCNDLKSKLDLVKGETRAKSLSLHTAHNKMMLLRKTMESHCSEAIFRTFGLCADADDFIKALVNVKNIDVTSHISNVYSVANGFCKNIKVNPNENKKVWSISKLTKDKSIFTTHNKNIFTTPSPLRLTVLKLKEVFVCSLEAFFFGNPSDLYSLVLKNKYR